MKNHIFSCGNASLDKILADGVPFDKLTTFLPTGKSGGYIPLIYNLSSGKMVIGLEMSSKDIDLRMKRMNEIIGQNENKNT